MKNWEKQYIMSQLFTVARPDLFQEKGVKYTEDELAALIADDNRPIFVYEDDNGKVIALLKETVAQLNQDNLFPLELTINYNKIPVEANKNSTLIQAIQKQFDTPLPVLGGPATTDAAEFIKSQKQFDIVVFGPGVTTVPHQINEYVEISNYFEQIDIYKKIITTYLSDE